MGTIVVPLPGRNEIKSKTHMRRIELTPTGMVMKNQVPHDGPDFISPTATIFCGDAIGESIPPMLEARAMPRIKAFDMFESAGRLRSIGWSVSLIQFDDAKLTWIIEKHNTGAATLLIHMLANAATNMLVTRTARGFVPALLRTNVAILFAISYLESAAAMVNPPSSSIITGDHIAGKIYFAALRASSRRCVVSSRMTLRTTHKNGIIKDVTKRGIT
jgi:hypothetical protein